MGGRRDPSFHDILEEVQGSAAGYPDLRPGDLGGPGGFELLRHLDGSLCRWVEDDLEPEDARRCVVAGADLYLNIDGYPQVEILECDDIAPQLWLRHADACEQSRCVPVPLDPEDRPQEISLYKGPDGQFVLHVVGPLRWGENLCICDGGDVVVPENAVLLSGPGATVRRA